jgi:DNA-binding transcriptional ArsR family regulator
MLAHPTRRRILLIVAERVASPREMAEELDAPIGRISHHVRWLATHGFIELVRTEPRRGAVEHFYRSAVPPVFSDAAWRDLPAARRRELAGALLRDIWSDVLDAGEGRAFAAGDAHLSRTRLELDEQGRRELAEALEDVVQAALRIQEESDERSGGRRGRSSEIAVLHFDVPRR